MARVASVSGVTAEQVEAPRNYVDFEDEPEAEAEEEDFLEDLDFFFGSGWPGVGVEVNEGEKLEGGREYE